MISEKLRRVLNKYEILVSPDMTDAEGWVLVSQRDRQTKRTMPAISVCFSGFTQSAKDELASRAKDAGFAVNSNVVNSTTHLCCGPLGAGSSKIKKAEGQAVSVVDETEFCHMLETGEIL